MNSFQSVTIPISINPSKNENNVDLCNNCRYCKQTIKKLNTYKCLGISKDISYIVTYKCKLFNIHREHDNISIYTEETFEKNKDAILNNTFVTIIRIDKCIEKEVTNFEHKMFTLDENNISSCTVLIEVLANDKYCSLCPHQNKNICDIFKDLLKKDTLGHIRCPKCKIYGISGKEL